MPSRYGIALFALLALSACKTSGDKSESRTHPAQTSLSTEEMIAATRSGVVTIEMHKSKNFFIGSGSIITNDGFVITNSHVVEQVPIVKVYLFLDADSSEPSVALLGVNVTSSQEEDLAVLKLVLPSSLKNSQTNETLEPDRFPTVKWGDSDHLRTGQSVVALGSPQGYAETYPRH